MSVLVTYVTRYGATRQVAQQVAAVLAVDGQEVRVRAATAVGTLEPYDAVVLGVGRGARGWMGDGLTFVERHADALRRLPVWLFSCGPLVHGAVPADSDLQRVAGLVGARSARSFGGALEVRRLDPVDRTRRLLTPPHHRAAAGDYRDWGDIEQWARALSTDLARAVERSDVRHHVGGDQA